MVMDKGKKKGQREALRRAMEVLEGLWKALGIPQSPPIELAEGLVESGREVVVQPSHREKEAVIGRGASLPYFRFPTRLLTFPRVLLMGDARGDVEVEVEDIFARRGKVFYTAFHASEVPKRVEVARTFHPLFESLGLGDLGDALETLLGLEDGEARKEGEYLLVRRGYFLLKRGSLLGDFALDKAFFTLEEVKISFPGDVELALRGRGFYRGMVHLTELKVRWEREEVRLGGGQGIGNWVGARANGRDPIGELVRKQVGRDLGVLDPPPSPGMRALLEVLAEKRRPLEALKGEDFLREVFLAALSRF
jgi:hypothetical protein